MKRRGKVVALSTAAVGLVVLVAAVVIGKDWIREHWYWHQFEVGKEDEKLDAAERLAALGCDDAIPWVFEEMLKEYISGLEHQRQQTGGILDGPPQKYLGERGERFQMTLARIGKLAAPMLIRARQDYDFDTTTVADLALAEMGQELWLDRHPESSRERHGVHLYSAGVPELILQEVAVDETQPSDVRKAAAEALNKVPLLR